jgi:hypothetical protein
MRKGFWKSVFVFGIVFLFIGSYLIPHISGDTQTTENISIVQNEQQNKNFKINSHPATQEEIATFKQKIGVRDPNKNYNVIINGHGTGFAPPTEEEYEQMVGSIQIVDYTLTQAPLGFSVDLSSDPCFPKVGNQGSQGSCAAWAATYYATGYVQAKLHNWNQAYSGNSDQLLSPTWTYNKCNRGIDHGSWPVNNMMISKTVGVCRLSKLPYNSGDYTSWGSEDAWRDAPPYRVNNVYAISHDINSVKAVIAAGYPVTFILDAYSYTNFGTDDALGSNAMRSSLNHANTVVGYDDSKVDKETGEVGAFKIVNSWGQWGPDYNGYYWMTYQAFRGSWNSNPLNYVDALYTDNANNTHPTLLGIWNLNPQCDRSATIKLGIGPYSNPVNPVKTRTPSWDGSSRSMHQYPSFMCLDITEFMDTWAMDITSFSLQIGDAAMDGMITSFKVEYYENSYTPGGSSSISPESPNTPKSTPCYVTLNFIKGSSIDIGYLHIEKPGSNPNCYITLATIPNINVANNGERVVFCAHFYMDCPGAADDGYVDISFLDGTDNASAHTGTHLEGPLLIAHFMVPGQQVTIKLHLKYTDWWGTKILSEIAKYNNESALPGSPSNLNAYNPTLASIDLTWTKGIGADKTKILRKTDGYPSSPTDGTQVYFGTGNSFPDTGLNSGTTYYYRAWSYYSFIGAYSLGYSQDNETTMYPNEPPTFGTPSPTNESTSQPFSFTWSIPITDPEGNTFYWMIKCSNGQYANMNGSSNGTKSLTVSGLAYSTTYKVWVNATDYSSGSGLYTRKWYTFTTLSNTNLPPVFGAPSPTNSSTNNPLSLTWSIPITDPEGNTFYWMIKCSNGQYANMNGSSNGTKSLTVSGLAYSTTYKIWVNATDPTGSNQYTRRWYSFTTQSGGNQPPVYGSPTPTNGSINQPLSFTFSIPINDPNGDLFSWTIHSSNGQTKTRTGQTGGTYSMTLTGLTSGKTYKVWVNATDPTGSNRYTRRWYTYTTQGGGGVNQPPVYGSPTPANGSINQPLSFTFSILINDPNGDLFLWTIQCSNGQTNGATGATNGTKTLSLTGLASSTTYKIWVNATDPTGSNQYTRRWYSFTTQSGGNQPPVLGTPTPANGSINLPLSFTFSIPMSDPEGNPFTWTIHCSNGQTKTRTGQTGGTYSMTLVGLTSARTYRVWVNATDPAPGSGLYTRRWYTYTTQ